MCDKTNRSSSQMNSVNYSKIDNATINKQCSHSHIVEVLCDKNGDKIKRNCSQCGCFISQSGVKTIKEAHLEFFADVPPIELYEHYLDDEQLFSYYQLYKQQLIILTDSELHELQQVRKSLIEKIFEFGEKLRQQKLTIHIACAYFDLILFKFFIQEHDLRKDKGVPYTEIERSKKQRLDLKAQTCLLLASKYDELDDRIPLIREIQKLAKFEFPYKDCKSEEGTVLFALNWNLMIITPLHLIQSLLGMGIIFEDEKIKSTANSSNFTNTSILTNNNVKEIDDFTLKRVRRFAEYFADLVQKNNLEFQCFKPSILAISCIISARMASSISPLWSEKMTEMTNFDYAQSQEIAECFEKLYVLYDQNFKPQKDLYLSQINIKPQINSMISTCEPTPNNQQENSNLFNNKMSQGKSNVLESNQNIMNDSFIKSSKSQQKDNQQKQSQLDRTCEDEEVVDLGDDSIATIKASEQYLNSISNAKITINIQHLNSSLNSSNRASVSNINLQKIQPLHKIITSVIDENVPNLAKRKSNQVKFNKENQQTATQAYLQKQILPKSCRLSTNPPPKADSSMRDTSEHEKTSNCSIQISKTIPQTRCPSNMSHQTQNLNSQNKVALSQSKQLSILLKQRNQSANNLHLMHNKSQNQASQLSLSQQQIQQKINQIAQKHKISSCINNGDHYSNNQQTMSSRIQAIKSLNSSRSRKQSASSHNNSISKQNPTISASTSSLINLKLKSLNEHKSKAHNLFGGCKTSRNSNHNSRIGSQYTQQQAHNTHQQSLSMSSSKQLFSEVQDHSQNKLEELKTKYKSEITNFKQTRERSNSNNGSITGRNNKKSGHNQISQNWTATSMNQIVERCNSESAGSFGLMSESLCSQTFVHSRKQEKLQFQTIQDDLKRKNTIMEEESECDGEKSNIEYFDNQQNQPNEEFLVQDEDTVIIKKPISSKKSKSLENINKITGMASKKATEKFLLDLYKKQYQIASGIEIQEQQTRNLPSNIRQITKVTTIDLSSATPTISQGLNKSSSQFTKTNFIKKNIHYISELNSQLQQSLDQIAIADSSKEMQHSITIKEDQSVLLSKRTSRCSQSLKQQEMAQKQNEILTQRRFSKYNRLQNYNFNYNQPNSSNQSSKLNLVEKSQSTLLASKKSYDYSKPSSNQLIQSQIQGISQVQEKEEKALDNYYHVDGEKSVPKFSLQQASQQASTNNLAKYRFKNPTLSTSSSQKYLKERNPCIQTYQKDSNSKQLLNLTSESQKNFFTAFTKTFKEKGQKAVSPNSNTSQALTSAANYCKETVNMLKSYGVKVNLGDSYGVISSMDQQQTQKYQNQSQMHHLDVSKLHRRISNQSQAEMCQITQPCQQPVMPLTARVARSISIQMQSNNWQQQQNQNCVKFQKFQARKPSKKEQYLTSNTSIDNQNCAKKSQLKHFLKPNDSYRVMCNTIDNTQESTIDEQKLQQNNNSMMIHFAFQSKISPNQSCNYQAIPQNQYNKISKNNSQILSTSINQDIPPSSGRQSNPNTHRFNDKITAPSSTVSSARVANKYNAKLQKPKDLVIKEEDEFKKIVGNFKKQSVGVNAGIYNLMGKNK